MSSGSTSKMSMASRTFSLLCMVTVLNLPIYLVNCEMFTAMTDLERLLYAERDIAVDLRDYIRLEEKRIEKLRAVVSDYESHSSDALRDKEKYLGNPVNLYLLVKRFTMEFDDVLSKFITNDTTKAFLDRLAGKQKSFPSGDDLSGAINALLRIQDTYQIPSAKMASGKFLDSASTLISPELTAQHCFEIGKQAYYDSDYYHTLMWMQEAYDRWHHEVNKTSSLVEVLDYLSYTAAQQGNIKYALKLTNELIEEDPGHIRAQNNKIYYDKLLAQEAAKNPGREADESHGVINTRYLDEFRNTEEFLGYEKLCRGEVTHPAPKKLKCRYVHRKNPLLWLSPLKEETMHDKPRIDVYHGMLSDREIEVVKRLARPRLGRATVQNSQTGVLETASYRISKSAWLKNHEHKVVRRISERIEALTGLDMSTAEELQVANYGIGGHYEPHFDFARKEEKSAFEPEIGNRVATMLFYKTEYRKEPFKRLGTGNRIATLMFYMSDVEAGGATVFPHIGAKVFPEKGKGVFWYNLHKSGEGDLLTRHAACPVLAGIKWVSNKWIHERGQEFRRPCSTNKDL
ncbi:prolyl 4-hydroxylase subunit alpha-1-like isoform X2 [Lineus longissimus]|uniref:prolyl 4-hydroxylase subunit alpha-1-like isoform X2 n=1 Tax=Lineus longissimus TaxID=88925 RepID=UPI00315DC913